MRFQYLEPIDRKAGLSGDITYGTNNEFGFDYLRDNMVRSLDEVVQRGHYYAIVDEVDNILIDEARTPLIISGQADQPSERCTALRAAGEGPEAQQRSTSVEMETPTATHRRGQLRHRSVYPDRARRRARSTQAGPGRRAERDNLYSPENADMLPYLDNALRAHVVYHRDKDYVVIATAR
ncbi:MAG: hypothetical protein KatS3mg052_2662 [Candidatus Roseilinea sp.]|nr:MAG: hypothetical protein KatS3mg052_2662 [Candidatus Roseilinea sp.]